MKKLISILLLICTITICLSSCGGSNDNSNNDNTPTCETTNLHTYENGECTGCGLKVFDVLKDYLLKNGEQIGFNYSVGFGSYETDSYYAFIGYNSQDNYIYISSNYQFIPGLSDSHIFYMELKLTPYTFEDGGFEWSASCRRLFCNCPTVRGTLDPQKFSSSTSTLEYTSSENGADEVVRNARKALQGCIKDYYIDFLKGVGSNLSIGSIGFVRYE